MVSGDWKKKLEAIQSKATQEAKLLPHGFLTGMGTAPLVPNGTNILCLYQL